MPSNPDENELESRDTMRVAFGWWPHAQLRMATRWPRSAFFDEAHLAALSAALEDWRTMLAASVEAGDHTDTKKDLGHQADQESLRASSVTPALEHVMRYYYRRPLPIAEELKRIAYSLVPGVLLLAISFFLFHSVFVFAWPVLVIAGFGISVIMVIIRGEHHES